MDDLAEGDEAELGERDDSIAVERGLEGEVEAGERLDRGQAPHAQCRLDPAVLAQGQLFREEDVHGFEGGDLALLEPAYDMIERFERPRGDGVGEGQRALSDPVARAMKDDLIVPQSLSALVDVDVAMTRLDMTLVSAFEDGMGGQ